MESTRFEQFARLAAVALLLLGCVLVLRPFFGAILFAGILVLSTWPAFAGLRERWNGRGWLAALTLVLFMVIALAVPIALAAQSLIVHSAGAVEAVRGYIDRGGIQLPSFLRELPLVGTSLNDYWTRVLGNREELVALAKRLADPAQRTFVALGGVVGEGLVQMLLALFIAYFFYRDGDRARSLIVESMTRLAGPAQGAVLIATAQGAIKGVVYGLLGTAFAQAGVALLGFLIAGVPGAFVLAALTFLLSLVPMGPVLAWGGAAAYLYAQDEVGWSIFMIVYGIAVISSVDNFLKPILMSRAGNLSMLLVVLGVFGGAVAFGFMGLFVGPALLAVAWNLAKAWLDRPIENAA